MYTYLLVLLVVLFTLHKFDFKEGLDVEVVDEKNIKLTGPQESKKSPDLSKLDWSQYVLKSSIPTQIPKSGALIYSSDEDFQYIEDCYSRNKPSGDSLKWKDFVGCLTEKHSEACPKSDPKHKASVPHSGTTKNNKDNTENSKDSGTVKEDIKKLYNNIKTFISSQNENYIYIGIAVVIMIIVLVLFAYSSPSSNTSYSPQSPPVQ